MEKKILESVRSFIGLSPDDDSYDCDFKIILYNALSKLKTLGAINEIPIITADTTIDSIVNDPNKRESALTILCIETKLVFDTPTGNTATVLGEVLKETAYRMVYYE